MAKCNPAANPKHSDMDDTDGGATVDGSTEMVGDMTKSIGPVNTPTGQVQTHGSVEEMLRANRNQQISEYTPQEIEPHLPDGMWINEDGRLALDMTDDSYSGDSATLTDKRRKMLKLIRDSSLDAPGIEEAIDCDRTSVYHTKRMFRPVLEDDVIFRIFVSDALVYDPKNDSEEGEIKTKEEAGETTPDSETSRDEQSDASHEDGDFDQDTVGTLAQEVTERMDAPEVDVDSDEIAQSVVNELPTETVTITEYDNADLFDQDEWFEIASVLIQSDAADTDAYARRIMESALEE